MLTGTDQRHRFDTLKLAQGYHLASHLFSLDEIIIPPRLMAPPPLVDPDQPPPYEDIITAAIPYTPDFPQLAAFYETNTLGVFDALGGGANLVITGLPGTGKSTTLAYLASVIARQDPIAGHLQNHVPFLLHAANLVIPPDSEDDPLAVIITAISAQASALTQPRLSEMIRASFDSGRAILLLDGMDEMAPQQLEEQVAYLEQLVQDFPSACYILTADPSQVGRLPTLGFFPLPLAAWGPKIQAEFIQRWRNLWEKFIAPAQTDESQVKIDPMLLNGWLLNLAPTVNPLEFTLKLWALYAGDVRGPSIIDSLEAYIRRLVVNLPKARHALDFLASQLLLNMEFAFSESQGHHWLSQDMPETQDPDDRILEVEPDGDSSTTKISATRILPDLVNTDLLVSRQDHRVSFSHPLLAAYLGGTALARQGNTEILTQPDWPLKSAAVPFLASRLDLSPLIPEMLADAGDPLHRQQIQLGRWLPFLPPSIPARKSILQKLSTDLQNDSLALGLRYRMLTTLLISGDPGVSTLLRHLLNHQYETVRQMAVLGCGFLRDSQSVGEITRHLRDSLHVGQAACMALVYIGTKPALEAAASIILNGDEMLRRAAAEAFAGHPQEGHPILVDGSKVEDLLVRRATIYGLRRVNQPWATEILEHLQIEDAQWVVKDAAADAVNQLMAPNPSIPIPQTPLSEIPWLIAFASDRESGISEGDSARNMLLKALEADNTDQILAAMGQIRLRGETEIFPVIYHILFGLDPELTEAAFHTIWHVASMGAPVPSLTQFGLS
jgi:hypothetical protein